MKWPGEMIQNLPYFIYYTKTQNCFFRFSLRVTLFFSLINALVYVDVDQYIEHSLGEKIEQYEMEKAT